MRPFDSAVLTCGMAAWLVTTVACTESIPVDNTLATLSEADMVTRHDEDTILIAYTLADAEGDDQSILIEICEGEESSATACGLAFEGEGSDNTAFVPTMSNGAPVRHVFGWDVACGRIVGEMPVASELSQRYVARLRVRNAPDTQPWLYSPSFVPGELGLDALDACMR